MIPDINKQLFDLKIAISKARYNLMFIILLTVINILCIIFKGEALIPFSCSIATFGVAFGIENSLLPLGLTISVLILLPLLVCYFLSNKNVLFIVAPVGILVVDTLALIVISVISGAIASANFFIDLIFHVISIFYLIKAIKAHKLLGDFEKVSGGTIASIDEVNNIDNTEEELSEPLGKYEDDGTIPLLKGEHEGLHIFVVIRNSTAELVINNYICDSLEVKYLDEFELKAIVNSISFTFQYTKDTQNETMFLYADEILLDSVTNL